jgi:hypothetical protein
VFTTSGGPRIFSRFYSGDRAIKVLTKDTLRFCGLKTKGLAIGGAQKKLDDQKKQEIHKKVQKVIDFLQ